MFRKYKLEKEVTAGAERRGFQKKLKNFVYLSFRNILAAAPLDIFKGRQPKWISQNSTKGDPLSRKGVESMRSNLMRVIKNFQRLFWPFHFDKSFDFPKLKNNPVSAKIIGDTGELLDNINKEHNYY